MAGKGSKTGGFNEIFGGKEQKLKEYEPYFPVDFGVTPIYQIGVKPIMRWEGGKPTDEVELTEEGYAKAWREFSIGEPGLTKQRFRFVDEFKTPADAKEAIELNGKQVDFNNPMITPKAKQKPNSRGFVTTVYEWVFTCYGVSEHINTDVLEYEQELQEQQELEDKADGK